MLQVQRTLSISINFKNPKGEEIIKSGLTVFSLMEHKIMMHLTTGDRINQTPPPAPAAGRYAVLLGDVYAN